MGKRMNSAFDMKSQRITAFEIHKWVYSNLKLEEQGIIMIQIDGIRRQEYIKVVDPQKAVDIVAQSYGTRG